MVLGGEGLGQGLAAAGAGGAEGWWQLPVLATPSWHPAF